MAASLFTLYDKAIVNEASGLIDFATDDFVAVLLADTYTPNTSSHETYSNVSTHEITGTGYTTGGEAVTLTVSAVGPVVTITPSVDPEWTAATFSAKYAVLIQKAGVSLAGTDLLIGYVDLDEGGGEVSISSGTLKINWSTTGIIVKDATVV